MNLDFQNLLLPLFYVVFISSISCVAVSQTSAANTPPALTPVPAAAPAASTTASANNQTAPTTDQSVNSIPSSREIESPVAPFPSGIDPVTKLPIVRIYPMRNRFSVSFAEDGFPIRDQMFNFNPEELRQMNNLEVMKAAIKREQRRLTTLFFKNHPGFQNRPPHVVNELISKTADEIDEGLDSVKSMYALSSFSFEYLRGHLLRVSSYNIALFQNSKKSLLQSLKPTEPLEYVAVAALLISLGLGIFTIQKEI